MGCQSSRVRVVQTTDGRKKGWGEKGKPAAQDELKSPRNTGTNGRDGSALSKGTMDSGLGPDDEGAGNHLPGIVEATSPRRANVLNNDVSLLNRQADIRERQTSTDILEELMSEGIIQSETKVVRNGEAYDVMMEKPGKSLRRPPAKLEKLKTKKKKNKSLTMEAIEAKMKAAEERRKTKEEELKKRLRERPMTALPSVSQFRRDGAFTPDDGQEGEETTTETLDSAALENVMSEPTESLRIPAEELDEIGAVESDNTYNKPSDQTDDFENDLF
ncbi:PREDICTED: stathmin domain-containing protein 1 [Nanorana parkeri]|uniref:stathmin domain-containing protein 1 n=1 Tax=Nanorana parkeri TaxID=125878 RepID=UPI0008541773|nr:PREDICTED: stathmin domain-containing protein 1 [Nanorana parkeri]